MNSEEIFMQRAMELARLGMGTVRPNPLVGCVIVHENKIIGEGWHKKYGEAHAEVHAVNAVVDKSLLKESTVYVNLEPCSHFGKTPPCADLLIKHNVKKVVVSTSDSNPLVKGKGIAKLRDAKIEVVEGVLQKEGRELNRRFFTGIEKQRPYMILKWAQTEDGFVARENYESKWITNEHSRQLVHKWRGEEDAILVGTQTARYDNPKLNVRDWSGRNPVRVVIDRYLNLDPALHIFDRSQKTICYNTRRNEEVENLQLVRLEEKDFLQQLAEDLYKKKIQSVMIEGGAQTLRLFIEAGLWDEARIFEARTSFGAGISAPSMPGHLIEDHEIFGDQLKVYRNT
jgi:diaminohydroxyphosphoribosylaminopyrimidine deaminase/5-amino-6-(5-phosphoribosylamino)uracil reductase